MAAQWFGINCVNSLNWLTLTGKTKSRETGPQNCGPQTQMEKTTGPFVLSHGLLPQMTTLPSVTLWHATHHPFSSSTHGVRTRKTEIRELIWETGEQDTDICFCCYLMLLRNCMFLFPRPANSSLG